MDRSLFARTIEIWIYVSVCVCVYTVWVITCKTSNQISYHLQMWTSTLSIKVFHQLDNFISNSKKDRCWQSLFESHTHKCAHERSVNEATWNLSVKRDSKSPEKRRYFYEKFHFIIIVYFIPISWLRFKSFVTRSQNESERG